MEDRGKVIAIGLACFIVLVQFTTCVAIFSSSDKTDSQVAAAVETVPVTSGPTRAEQWRARMDEMIAAPPDDVLVYASWLRTAKTEAKDEVYEAKADAELERIAPEVKAAEAEAEKLAAKRRAEEEKAQAEAEKLAAQRRAEEEKAQAEEEKTAARKAAVEAKQKEARAFAAAMAIIGGFEITPGTVTVICEYEKYVDLMFQYKAVNAFGTTAVNHYRAKLSWDMTDVKEEKETFIRFEK